jgi:hypothetical protein
MKIAIPVQLRVGLGIVILGGMLVGGEYLLVKWWPGHEQRVSEATLKLLPYRNDALGVTMQVAAGIYGKVDTFADGAKIYRPNFWSTGPSLTLTTQPNPDKSFEFTPQILAKWQTRGTIEEIPRYTFERTQIQNRDAVLIWYYRDRAMWVTAHIISPDHIVQADCSTGRADEALYLQACEESLRSIQVAGPQPPAPPKPSGVIELKKTIK